MRSASKITPMLTQRQSVGAKYHAFATLWLLLAALAPLYSPWLGRDFAALQPGHDHIYWGKPKLTHQHQVAHEGAGEPEVTNVPNLDVGGGTAVPILTVAELYALSPGDFEVYVGQLFRQKGYRVKLRGGSGDLGVDVELRKRDGKKAVVQCKRYRTTVGSETVRDLYGTLIHERAAHAFLVTTADISDAAREWAQYKPITLIDGETLVRIATSLQNRPV